MAVARAGERAGAVVRGFASSGLPGPKGNLETFVWLSDPGAGPSVDIAGAAEAVEP
jgi:23S rRNA (cytidine1920-2'-O)/16S rRNA (cytidine1409-2'-O)-methyltransferase